MPGFGLIFFTELQSMSMKSNNPDNDGDEMNFADLLDRYSPGAGQELRVGDQINGAIIDIGGDTVFVDTGTKIDGVIEKADLIGFDGEFNYKIGDALELYVVSKKENEVRLSRAMSGSAGSRLALEAYERAIPVEGKVIGTCKGGFNVVVLDKRAFCPISQIDGKFVENGEDYVGKTFNFIITQFEHEGKNIVVSRRRIIKEEQERAQIEFLSKAKVGDIIEGKVTKVMHFGAFVEIYHGLEGMVHVSEMSWSRVENPDEFIKSGDTVKIKLIGVDENDDGNRRISFSMKQAVGDPWDEVASKFRFGDKIDGKVTRCAKFGAFVEIAPGIEGLVHISEMSYTRRVMKPEEVANPGDVVRVMIKEIDVGSRRISLSIKDADGDPWEGIEEKYKPGQLVEGVLERREKFGFFINIEPGVTALLPKSKIKDAGDPTFFDKLGAGDKMAARVVEIDPQARKMTLGPADQREVDDWRKFARDDESRPESAMAEQLRKLNLK